MELQYLKAQFSNWKYTNESYGSEVIPLEKNGLRIDTLREQWVYFL